MNKATGPDKIGSVLLKNVADLISEPLCKIFNYSIQNSTFPSMWKKSKALEKLFTCRIRPIIEYGNFIYDNCPKYLSNRLEQLQMEAARICTGAMRQTSADKILTIFF